MSKCTHTQTIHWRPFVTHMFLSDYKERVCLWLQESTMITKGLITKSWYRARWGTTGTLSVTMWHIIPPAMTRRCTIGWNSPGGSIICSWRRSATSSGREWSLSDGNAASTCARRPGTELRNVITVDSFGDIQIPWLPYPHAMAWWVFSTMHDPSDTCAVELQEQPRLAHIVRSPNTLLFLTGKWFSRPGRENNLSRNLRALIFRLAPVGIRF